MKQNLSKLAVLSLLGANAKSVNDLRDDELVEITQSTQVNTLNPDSNQVTQESETIPSHSSLIATEESSEEWASASEQSDDQAEPASDGESSSDDGAVAEEPVAAVAVEDEDLTTDIMTQTEEQIENGKTISVFNVNVFGTDVSFNSPQARNIATTYFKNFVNPYKGLKAGEISKKFYEELKNSYDRSDFAKFNGAQARQQTVKALQKLARSETYYSEEKHLLEGYETYDAQAEQAYAAFFKGLKKESNNGSQSLGDITKTKSYTAFQQAIEKAKQGAIQYNKSKNSAQKVVSVGNLSVYYKLKGLEGMVSQLSTASTTVSVTNTITVASQTFTFDSKRSTQVLSRFRNIGFVDPFAGGVTMEQARKELYHSNWLNSDLVKANFNKDALEASHVIQQRYNHLSSEDPELYYLSLNYYYYFYYMRSLTSFASYFRNDLTSSYNQSYSATSGHKYAQSLITSYTNSMNNNAKYYQQYIKHKTYKAIYQARSIRDFYMVQTLKNIDKYYEKLWTARTPQVQLNVRSQGQTLPIYQPESVPMVNRMLASFKDPFNGKPTAEQALEEIRKPLWLNTQVVKLNFPSCDLDEALEAKKKYASATYEPRFMSTEYYNFFTELRSLTSIQSYLKSDETNHPQKSFDKTSTGKYIRGVINSLTTRVKGELNSTKQYTNNLYYFNLFKSRAIKTQLRVQITEKLYNYYQTLWTVSRPSLKTSLALDGESYRLYDAKSIPIVNKFKAKLVDPFNGKVTKEQAYKELKQTNWYNTELVKANFKNCVVTDAAQLQSEMGNESYETRRLAVDYYSYIQTLRGYSSIASKMQGDLINLRHRDYKDTAVSKYLTGLINSNKSSATTYSKYFKQYITHHWNRSVYGANAARFTFLVQRLTELNQYYQNLWNVTKPQLQTTVKVDNGGIPLYQPESAKIMESFKTLVDPFSGKATKEEALKELKTSSYLRQAVIRDNFDGGKLQESYYVYTKHGSDDYELRRVAYEYYLYVYTMRGFTSVASYLKNDLNSRREEVYTKTTNYGYIEGQRKQQQGYARSDLTNYRKNPKNYWNRAVYGAQGIKRQQVANRLSELNKYYEYLWKLVMPEVQQTVTIENETIKFYEKDSSVTLNLYNKDLIDPFGGKATEQQALKEIDTKNWYTTEVAKTNFPASSVTEAKNLKTKYDTSKYDVEVRYLVQQYTTYINEMRAIQRIRTLFKDDLNKRRAKWTSTTAFGYLNGLKNSYLSSTKTYISYYKRYYTNYTYRRLYQAYAVRFQASYERVTQFIAYYEKMYALAYKVYKGHLPPPPPPPPKPVGQLTPGGKNIPVYNQNTLTIANKYKPLVNPYAGKTPTVQEAVNEFIHPSGWWSTRVVDVNFGSTPYGKAVTFYNSYKSHAVLEVRYMAEEYLYYYNDLRGLSSVNSKFKSDLKLKLTSVFKQTTGFKYLDGVLKNYQSQLTQVLKVYETNKKNKTYKARYQARAVRYEQRINRLQELIKYYADLWDLVKPKKQGTLSPGGTGVDYYDPNTKELLDLFKKPLVDPFNGKPTKAQAITELKTSFTSTKVVNENFPSSLVTKAGQIRSKYSSSDMEIRKIALEYLNYVNEMRSTTSTTSYYNSDWQYKRHSAYEKTTLYTYLNGVITALEKRLKSEAYYYNAYRKGCYTTRWTYGARAIKTQFRIRRTQELQSYYRRLWKARTPQLVQKVSTLGGQVKFYDTRSVQFLNNMSKAIVDPFNGKPTVDQARKELTTTFASTEIIKANFGADYLKKAYASYSQFSSADYEIRRVAHDAYQYVSLNRGHCAGVINKFKSDLVNKRHANFEQTTAYSYLVGRENAYKSTVKSYFNTYKAYHLTHYWNEAVYGSYAVLYNEVINRTTELIKYYKNLWNTVKPKKQATINVGGQGHVTIYNPNSMPVLNLFNKKIVDKFQGASYDAAFNELNEKTYTKTTLYEVNWPNSRYTESQKINSKYSNDEYEVRRIAYEYNQYVAALRSYTSTFNSYSKSDLLYKRELPFSQTTLYSYLVGQRNSFTSTRNTYLSYYKTYINHYWNSSVYGALAIHYQARIERFNELIKYYQNLWTITKPVLRLTVNVNSYPVKFYQPESVEIVQAMAAKFTNPYGNSKLTKKQAQKEITDGTNSALFKANWSTSTQNTLKAYYAKRSHPYYEVRGVSTYSYYYWSYLNSILSATAGKLKSDISSNPTQAFENTTAYKYLKSVHSSYSSTKISQVNNYKNTEKQTNYNSSKYTYGAQAVEYKYLVEKINFLIQYYKNVWETARPSVVATVDVEDGSKTKGLKFYRETSVESLSLYNTGLVDPFAGKATRQQALQELQSKTFVSSKVGERNFPTSVLTKAQNLQKQYQSSVLETRYLTQQYTAYVNRMRGLNTPYYLNRDLTNLKANKRTTFEQTQTYQYLKGLVNSYKSTITSYLRYTTKNQAYSTQTYYKAYVLSFQASLDRVREVIKYYKSLWKPAASEYIRINIGVNDNVGGLRWTNIRKTIDQGYSAPTAQQKAKYISSVVSQVKSSLSNVYALKYPGVVSVLDKVIQEYATTKFSLQQVQQPHLDFLKKKRSAHTKDVQYLKYISEIQINIEVLQVKLTSLNNVINTIRTASKQTNVIKGANYINGVIGGNNSKVNSAISTISSQSGASRVCYECNIKRYAYTVKYYRAANEYLRSFLSSIKKNTLVQGTPAAAELPDNSTALQSNYIGLVQKMMNVEPTNATVAQTEGWGSFTQTAADLETASETSEEQYYY